jgi:voltage-gated potassium channel
MSATARPRIERWYERLTLVRAVGTILAVAITLVSIAGFLARIVEPDTFTSIGLAYWWAVTTVTTVGYGGVVGAMLMLTGLALIPTLTSVIVSTLLSKRRREEQEILERLEADQAAVLERIEERLERIERAQ